METIKCPYCGNSYYTVGYTTTTAMYFPPVIKDGVNINPDRNTSTTSCQCLVCHNTFYISRCGGDVVSVSKSN